MLKIQRYLFLSIILATLVLPFAEKSCADDEKEEDNSPVKVVETVKATRATISRSTTFIGVIKAHKSTVLKAKTIGIVEDLHVQDGALVDKDAILLSLEHQQVQKAFEVAKGAVDIAKAEFERKQKLIARKSGSLRELEVAQGKLFSAQKLLFQAQKELNNNIIKAPFGGVLGNFKVSIGAHVTQGDELVSLYDPSSLFVEFSVPESYLQDLKIGDDLKVADHIEHITAIEAAVSVTTHMGEVRANIKSDSKLAPGQFIDVDVIFDKHENTIVLPRSCLFIKRGEISVMVVKEGKVQVVEVETGVKNGDFVEILSGVEEGDIIVVKGQRRLHEDDKVENHEAS